MQAWIARISAGEPIDPDSVPDDLRSEPSLQRLLQLARVAEGLQRNLGAEDFEPPSPGQIGPWRLLHRIGSGGMGDVWIGERNDGAVEQRVAVKCVRLHSPMFRDRLASERRILARLQHPNIAHFIDAGVDAMGSPWLAMDYVDGMPITDWCERNRASLRTRLGLFLKVCGAVEHAHRHLVVHRDLKPANVLIDAEGEPKLLDFGIAKLLDGSEEGDTVAALTPSYAAPEQLRGEPVSAATDVYSLGLLMYRLLAGVLPATRRDNNAAIVLSRLLDEETQRPSASADPRLLPYPVSALDGDLDAIVAQAMRARPEARYGSVAELSADVERFLQSRPVHARVPSRTYRLGRFVLRNRLAVAMGALAACALMAGTAVSIQQAHRATREAESAQRELARAEKISGFLASLYREQDPLTRDQSEARSPQRVLADAVVRVGQELKGDGLSIARLLRVLGEAQMNLGDLKSAATTLDRAADHAGRVGDALLAAEIDALRAAVALRELRQDDAEALFARARAAAVALRGADSAETARIEALQAMSLVSLGKFKDALGAAEHAHTTLSAKLGPAHAESIGALVTLGIIEEQLRDDASAARTLRSAIDIIESNFGPTDARLGLPLQTLGEVLRRKRDFDAAREILKRGVEIARSRFGERHAQVAGLLVRLAGVERDAGRLERAIDVLGEAEAALPEQADDLMRAQVLNTRGSAWIELGNGSQAESDFRASLALRRKAGDQRSGLLWFTQAQLGSALAMQNRFDEAQKLQAEAAVEVRKLLGPDAYQNALIALRRAQTFELQGAYHDGALQWQEAVRLIEKTYGRDHFGYFDWSLQWAHDLEKTAAGRSQAASIADDLLARWTGNPQIADAYADLVLLRCRLHEYAGNRPAARALAKSALGASGPTITATQRQGLEHYAGAN